MAKSLKFSLQILLCIGLCADKCCSILADFKNQQRTSVPTGINGETTKLDLSQNQITVITPEKLKNLNKLSALILNSNNLETFPNLTFVKDILTELQIQSNQISSIEPGLMDMLVKIQILNLKDNKLGGNGFPDVFGPSSTLQQLDVSVNELTHFPPLHNIGKSLLALHLDKNSITNADFEGLESINELSIFGNLLSEFPDISGIVDTLKKIDLSKNSIHQVAEDRFIFSSTSDGLTIDLSENQLQTVPPLGGSVQNVDLNLYLNPLHCDTRIAWVIGMKGIKQSDYYLNNEDPSDDYYNLNMIFGTVCSTPESLANKMLTDLSFSDLGISQELPPEVIKTETQSSKAQDNFYGISTRVTEVEVVSRLECQGLCLPQKGCSFYNLKCLGSNLCLCHYSDPLGGADVTQPPNNGIGWGYYLVV